MKLSEVAMEVEEWLDLFTLAYEITLVEQKTNGGYQIHIFENVYTECFLTVEPNGRIINSNGDDVTEVIQEAYSDDEETIEWVRAFVEKWYKKGE